MKKKSPTYQAGTSNDGFGRAMCNDTPATAQFTAGPWHIGHSETDEPAIKNADGDCVAVACELLPGEARANARLIAAAPSLVAALKQIIEAADDPDNAKDRDLVEQIDWEQARSALDKATEKDQ